MNQVSMTCSHTTPIAPRCINQKGSNPDGVTKRLGAITAPRSLSAKRAATWSMALVLCLIHVGHAAQSGKRVLDETNYVFESPPPRVDIIMAGGLVDPELTNNLALPIASMKLTTSVAITILEINLANVDEIDHHRRALGEFHARYSKTTATPLLKLKMDNDLFDTARAHTLEYFLNRILYAHNDALIAQSRRAILAADDNFTLRFMPRHRSFQWDGKFTLTLKTVSVLADGSHRPVDTIRGNLRGMEDNVSPTGPAKRRMHHDLNKVVEQTRAAKTASDKAAKRAKRLEELARKKHVKEVAKLFEGKSLQDVEDTVSEVCRQGCQELAMQNRPSGGLPEPKGTDAPHDSPDPHATQN